MEVCHSVHTQDSDYEKGSLSRKEDNGERDVRFA